MSWLEPLLQLAVALPILVVACVRRQISIRAVVGAAVFFLAMTAAWRVSRYLDVIGGDWNWTGKLLAVVVSLVVIALVRETRRYVRLPERTTLAPVIAIGAVLLVVAMITGFVSDRAVFDAETLAFQATLPGLDEELAFRGVMLALLVSADGARRMPGLVAVSLLFGAVHGLSITSDGVSFVPGYFAWTTTVGVVWGWMTLRTRSILPAMISHNAANTVGYVLTLV